MRNETDGQPQAPDALAVRARRLIDEFSAVGAKLRGYGDVDEVLADLAEASVRLVPHADHAATSRRQRHGFVTVGGG
jgi:hypothetical protein